MLELNPFVYFNKRDYKLLLEGISKVSNFMGKNEDGAILNKNHGVFIDVTQNCITLVGSNGRSVCEYKFNLEHYSIEGSNSFSFVIPSELVTGIFSSPFVSLLNRQRTANHIYLYKNEETNELALGVKNLGLSIKIKNECREYFEYLSGFNEPKYNGIKITNLKTTLNNANEVLKWIKGKYKGNTQPIRAIYAKGESRFNIFIGRELATDITLYMLPYFDSYGSSKAENLKPFNIELTSFIKVLETMVEGVIQIDCNTPDDNHEFNGGMVLFSSTSHLNPSITIGLLPI